MIHLKNFTLYTPKDPEKLTLAKEIGVSFIRSEDGIDWYDCQKEFSTKTIKVTYNSDGIVTSTTCDNSCHDASKIWPLNRSILEIPNTVANRKIDNLGGWIVVDGKVKQRVKTAEEKIEAAEQLKKTLYANARTAMEPLSLASELGVVTDDESNKLSQLKLYLVALYRVDTSNPDSIEWPPLPTS